MQHRIVLKSSRSNIHAYCNGAWTPLLCLLNLDSLLYASRQWQGGKAERSYRQVRAVRFISILDQTWVELMLQGTCK